MIYLNEDNIKSLGINWFKCFNVIEEAVRCLGTSDTVQPIKPYLRFKDLKNRIIAMPAYVGGKFDIAGIKWIASFPKNIEKGIPRASSTVVLNDSNTGQVVSIINTNILSVIRTASVSGLILKKYIEARKRANLTIGIIGWGPVGKSHYRMCKEAFGDKISKIVLYDIKGIQADTIDRNTNIVIAKDWKEAYENSDIVMTCTVSNGSYIDKKPKDSSLLLNVSLRDYKTDIFDFVKDSIIVDDWEEVCREKTDIEYFHKEKGLNKEDTKFIVDVVLNECLGNYNSTTPIMFNPMGMAIFDVAIAKYYVDLATQNNIGTKLD